MLPQCWWQRPVELCPSSLEASSPGGWDGGQPGPRDMGISITGVQEVQQVCCRMRNLKSNVQLWNPLWALNHRVLVDINRSFARIEKEGSTSF